MTRNAGLRPDPIGPFRGPHYFLSNFFPCVVTLDGVQYPTVEHAYHAAKTLDTRLRSEIRGQPTPGAAKVAMESMPVREDWEHVKVATMLGLLRQKFARPDLRELLLATGTAPLVELNTWGDTFWGVCDGRGENRLGRLLMEIREALRAEPTTRA